jgi:hypothetical protein
MQEQHAKKKREQSGKTARKGGSKTSEVMWGTRQRQNTGVK